MDDPRRAPLHFCSNVDGDLHAVIDASLADLEGWKLEFEGPNGTTLAYEFEYSWHYGGPTNSNLIGYGEAREGWIAVAERGQAPKALVSPDGERIPFSPQPGDEDE
jgi:hypothetical protein